MIQKQNALAHVVFDNDGTLIKSEENFFEVLEKTLPHHLNRPVTITEIKAANVPDWIQLLKNLGIPDPKRELIQGIIDDINELNKDYVPELFPEVIDLIHELHSLNIATYVWTGRDSKSGRFVFNSHNMIDLFDAMEFMDTSTPKPHPHGLENMLGDVSKEKIVLIGDSLVDLKGAASFEIPCLIVDWDKKIDQKHFLDHGAAAIVQNRDHVIDWVKGNLL